MSNDQHGLEDWSTDSASLFRDARRAQDPTPNERAAIDAVFARLQAGSHMPPTAAERLPESLVRGATRGWLGTFLKGSLALVLVAAASFGVIRATRPRAELPSSEPAAGAAADAAVATVPVLTPRAQPGDFQPTPATVARLRPQQKDESRARMQPRRTSANSASQRTLARGKAPAHEANSLAPSAAPSAPSAPSAPGKGASSVTAAADDSIQHDRSEAVSAAPIQDAAPRTEPVEPKVQEVRAPAREPDSQPREALSELALLKRIHTELRESDFSAVLDLCAEHERRWPHGTFELERQGVRAIASCGASSDDAAQLASQFLKAHPHAPVAMRVRSACAAQLPKR